MNFIHFVNKVFEPKLHILFSFLWSLSLFSVICSQYGLNYSNYKSLEIIVIPISFLLTLLFLRMIDEIKDFEYDKIYKPDRPLVTGMTSFKQIKVYCIITALIVSSLNLLLNWKCSVVILSIIGYGLFLMLLERKSKKIRENIFLNLLVTFPVSSALNFYVLFYIVVIKDYTFNTNLLWVILSYVCIFLHFEFGRKTAWPNLLEKGEKVYALYIGGIGSFLTALFLCATACSIIFNFLNLDIWSIIVFLPLFLNLIAIVLLIKNKKQRINLYPFYGGALLLFYLTILIISWNGNILMIQL